MSKVTYITEQCGAAWMVSATGVVGERAYWVLKVSGVSIAKPSTVGFYAASIVEAANALSN